jgi:hypothetical protein
VRCDVCAAARLRLTHRSGDAEHLAAAVAAAAARPEVAEAEAAHVEGEA